MKNQRFAHIDAMRAVAVLLVVWTHSAEGFVHIAGSQAILDEVQKSFNFGRIGVVIFFAISGMLIPSSLKNETGVQQFLVRRFFRLFPAFWMSVAIYWIIIPGQKDLMSLAANLTMLPWLLGKEPLLGLYWTLETELYFYLVCIVVFWFGALHRLTMLAALTAFFAAAFVVANALHLFPDALPGPYKGLPLHLAIMFWGACFRKVWDAGNFRSRPFLSASLALLLACLMIFAYGLKTSDPKQIANGLAYLIGLSLFALFATKVLIVFKPAVFVGRISYSTYLLHDAVMTLMYTYLVTPPTSGLPLSLYMTTMAVLSICLSTASYITVESFWIRVGAAFSSFWVTSSGTVASADRPHRA